jgi:hypothetical protein
MLKPTTPPNATNQWRVGSRTSFNQVQNVTVAQNRCAASRLPREPKNTTTGLHARSAAAKYPEMRPAIVRVASNVRTSVRPTRITLSPRETANLAALTTSSRRFNP